MNKLLNKSIRLRRLHVAILVIVVSICCWIIIQYIIIIRVSIARYSFITSLVNLKNMFAINSVLTEVTDPQCHFLDNPNLFNETSNILNMSTLDPKRHPNDWQYDSKTHRLTYNVEPNQYFQSTIGSRITVDLKCKKGNVQIEVSPHHWCQKMNIWGCSSY